jgi:UDP:flavonoid glycosyltransferase YjiC (YdhE family)
MRHFGVVVPAFHSHVNSIAGLASELAARGHRVTFLQQPDIGAFVRDPRTDFHAVGADTHPPGSVAAAMRHAARPGGPLGIRRMIADLTAATDMLCRTLPHAFESLGIDAVLADEMEPAGALAAEGLGLPFVSVACAIPVNREPGLPLPVMPFGWGLDPKTLKMVEGSTRVYDWMMRPHDDVIARHARRFGLGERRGLHACLSPLAQVSQLVAGFDFPRREAPSCLHHVGPLRPVARPGHHVPDERMPLPRVEDGRPFVFASFGTMQGGRLALFERIARACRRLDAQLLVAHCGGLDAAGEQTLLRAGATWVCAFADQGAVMARADAIVSHAGLNTVLDAIAAGVPNLALPIAFDQPGAAARMRRVGAGIVVHPLLATSGRIERGLRQLLDDPGFAARLAPLAAEVRAAGGTLRAADIVEQALGLRSASATLCAAEETR